MAPPTSVEPAQEEHLDQPAPPSMATLSTPPAAGQLVSHGGEVYTTVKEGLAYILVPPTAKKAADPDEPAPKKAGRARGEKNAEHQTSQSVFYNEIMQYNRDLSVLAIRAYGEDRVERLRVRAERRERNEAKRRKERGGAPPKQDLSSTVANPPSVGDATVDAAREDSLPGNGAKRSSEEAQIGDDESQHMAKRLKEGSGTPQRDASTDVARLNKSQSVAPKPAEDAACPACEEVKGQAGREPANDAGFQTESASSTISKPHTASGKARNSRFKVLDALSATGLRALRYASELPFVDSVIANDLSAKATQMISMNVEHNNLVEKITPVTGNAVAHMYQFVGQEHKGGPGKQYDVIDLDPYGTAVPFLDSAVQALADGGLLCVTCTDTAVFMSNGYTEKAFSLYGGTTVKGQCAHEGGLRLMLHAIATTAARYGVAIEPLLSLSIDYYARVFVNVRKSPADVKFLMGKTMTLDHCDNGCFAITPQWLGKTTATEDRNGNPLWKHGYSAPDISESCRHCGFRTHINGPMWGGPLHNPHFIERILSYLPEIDRTTYPTYERIEGMLTTALEELQIFETIKPKPHDTTSTGTADAASSPVLIDPVPPQLRDLHPFYVVPSSLAKVLHCIAPGENHIRGALRHAGFKASRTHAARGGIKTDAPASAIWHIMREWVRQRAPIKPGALKENMAGWRILYGHDPTKWPTTAAEDEARKGAASDSPAGVEAPASAPEDDDTSMLNGGTPAALQAASEPGTRNTTNANKANGTLASVHPTRRTVEPTFEVIFDEELGKDTGRKLKRFQLNPRANWGPMARAK